MSRQTHTELPPVQPSPPPRTRIPLYASRSATQSRARPAQLPASPQRHAGLSPLPESYGDDYEDAPAAAAPRRPQPAQARPSPLMELADTETRVKRSRVRTQMARDDEDDDGGDDYDGARLPAVRTRNAGRSAATTSAPPRSSAAPAAYAFSPSSSASERSSSSSGVAIAVPTGAPAPLSPSAAARLAETHDFFAHIDAMDMADVFEVQE